MVTGSMEWVGRLWGERFFGVGKMSPAHPLYCCPHSHQEF